MNDRDFQLQVLGSLGELKADQRELKAQVGNIVARLDKLNGSVARHEDRIGALEMDRARREGASASNKTWMNRVWPFIWAGCGAMAILILANSHLFVGLLK